MNFFFSSRRRNTRFSRDRTSDVCSSDLPFNDDNRIRIIRQIEQGSVRQKPGSPYHRDFSQRQQGFVELQLAESPAVGHQKLQAPSDLKIDITVLLLQMLWSEEETFAPNYLFHGFNLCGRSRALFQQQRTSIQPDR